MRKHFLQARGTFAHLCVADQNVCARVPQNERDLVRLKKIVDGHEDAAREKSPEHQRDILRAILQPHRDTVAALDTEVLLEVTREPLRLAPKLVVRDDVLAPENSG